MSAVNRLATRRRVLRGMLGGAAVSVGLPFLDCFLNVNGDALAATGAKLPKAFGTWYGALWFNPGRWEPSAAGTIKEMAPELAALNKFKSYVNVYSGMKVVLDGRPSQPHSTGIMAVVTGVVPRSREEVIAAPSLDSLVADVIGSTTRFRSLEASGAGGPTSYSRRSGSVMNPAEPSPAALYTRLFGPEFRDPNAATFKPDPVVLARKSVLSAVKEQRQDLERDLGASGRARLDEYFTSVRQFEQQLALQLEKPAPIESCVIPKKMEGPDPSSEIEAALANHRLLAQLLAYAVACDQTRVINMNFSAGTSALRRAGSQMTHHIHSHEEPVDPKVGYQPETTWFSMRNVDAVSDMLTALSGIREGEGTLLDRIAMYITTDTGFAKSHSVENIPILTAGRAGGLMKTGLHIPSGGDPASRVGLTLQQVLGIPTNAWGTDAMQTTRTISEVMV